MSEHDTGNWFRIVRAERPAWQAVLAGAALLALVCATDFATRVSLSPLYLLPVAVVAWWGGLRMGMAMSLVSALTWGLAVHFGAEPFGRSTGAIAGEAALRLFFYGAFAWVLAALREAGRTLQATVDARTAALQSLAAELSAAEDAQRRQVAYDIHDALSQNLSLLKLRLEALRGARDGAAQPPGQFAQWLEDEIRIVDDLIRQTRTLSFELYPSGLDDLGLTPALQGLADQLRGRVGTEVLVMEQGERKPLPTSLAHFLFRAIKELVGNAVRHGKAAQVIISVHWRQEGLRIVVDDDGGGFSPAATVTGARRGLGLASIRQRIAALGGASQIESQPGEGARAILEVPIVPDRKEAPLASPPLVAAPLAPELSPTRLQNF